MHVMMLVLILRKIAAWSSSLRVTSYNQSFGSDARGLGSQPVRHARRLKNQPLKPHTSKGSFIGGTTRSSALIFQYGLCRSKRKKWRC